MTVRRLHPGFGRLIPIGGRLGTMAGITLVIGLVCAIVKTACLSAMPDDPALSLPRSVDVERTEQRIIAGTGRILEHVTLADPVLGSIGFTVSLPDSLPAQKMPLVVVFGGLGTGEHNLRAIQAMGPNVVAGYDWPLPTTAPRGLALVSALPGLRDHALAVPGQASAMLRWLAAQPWSDPKRITLIGFSLGAIAAPAIDRVARLEGVDAERVVLAYGGAGIADLVEDDKHIQPAWARPILGFAAAHLLAPLEPAAYLPHLSGHFLILDAAQDTIIDPRATARLEELTPSPKTIIHMKGGHVGTGPDKQALLAQAMAATRHWLETDGAIAD